MHRLLGSIGLIGGILALAGIFMTWVIVKAWGVWDPYSLSAWDYVTNAKLGGVIAVGRETWASIAFGGAILTIVGALSARAKPRIKILWGILALGGLLAIIGAVWGFSDIETDEYVSYGAGIYLTLIGGIFGLIGAIGLLKA